MPSEKWTFKYRPQLSWRNPGFDQTDSHPVTCISFRDALAYMEWLNLSGSNQYRLPTETEWEYVARAGTVTVYPWGDSPEGSCDYANVAEWSLWPDKKESPFGHINCNDGHAHTSEVGSFQPNSLGIFDLNGNVWEWTSDCYGKSYDETPVDEFCEQRTFRGSSWMNSASMLRIAKRGKNTPEARINTVGFRLVLAR